MPFLRPPGTSTANVPSGYCGCGCGTETSIAKSSDSQTGRVRGERLRYVHGHHRRRQVPFIRFWTGHTSDCWIWVGSRNPKGYGYLADGHGSCSLAHRTYFERYRGPIPKGLQIDHLCRMPPCVNPEHLQAVSPAENVRRGTKTKLTATDVAEIRSSTERNRELARRLPVGESQVSRIKRGLSWRSSSLSASRWVGARSAGSSLRPVGKTG